MRMRAETLEPTNDRRSGQAGFAGATNDRFIERPPFPAVGLTDEDPKKLTFALILQRILPNTTPTYNARSPAVRLPSALAKASP